MGIVKVVLYLDVSPGFMSAWLPTNFLGAMVPYTPAKPSGAKRYRVVVDVADPAEPDATAKATSQEEP